MIVVVCEGFHDRAFWKGFLETREPKWEDLPLGELDAHGRADLGKYSFRRGTCALRVEPANAGRRSLSVSAYTADILKSRRGKTFREVVINVDDDRSAADESAAGGAPIDDATAEKIVRDAGWESLPWTVIRWRVDDGAAELPNKQTLERLVCSAVREAHPSWLSDTRRFLDGRAEKRSSADEERYAHKAATAAVMAGWLPERVGDDFFRAVWHDAAVATALLSRPAVVAMAAVVERAAAASAS